MNRRWGGEGTRERGMKEGFQIDNRKNRAEFVKTFDENKAIMLMKIVVRKDNLLPY
jgi:hypothetical protein